MVITLTSIKIATDIANCGSFSIPLNNTESSTEIIIEFTVIMIWALLSAIWLKAW